MAGNEIRYQILANRHLLRCLNSAYEQRKRQCAFLTASWRRIWSIASLNRARERQGRTDGSYAHRDCRAKRLWIGELRVKSTAAGADECRSRSDRRDGLVHWWCGRRRRRLPVGERNSLLPGSAISVPDGW